LIPEEHAHHHGHGTGVRWLDIIVGLSAMFISVVSLVVSIEHGRTMSELVRQNEKLVAANTIPVLDLASSDVDDATKKPYFKLTVRNGGVGPAQIDWFQLRYKGVPYRRPDDLLRACCADAMAKQQPSNGSMWYSAVSGSILPVRDSVDPMTLWPTVGDDVLRAVYQVRSEITAKACYCSVLDECWVTDFGSHRPTKVERCEQPANEPLW
jgi:hypothetical protein